MIKSILIGSLVFSLFFSGNFPQYLGEINQTNKAICSFSLEGGYGVREPDISRARLVTASTDPSGIVDVIATIKQKLKINTRIDVYLQNNIENAYALLRNGKRTLIFDVNFLEKVNSSCGSEWCAIQIIAHELGHHIHGFSGDSHENELGADYWSGFILAKLGASRESTLKAIETYGTEYDTDTHPSVYKRVKAIEDGFDDAS